jgi:hypothetical protein
MAFNQFTNLDFNDIRSQIKDYLRANSNFTDFDFEGSNFSNIIDILAYNSYITSFNTNMAVNESFIDSATLRENVVSLARNIGYVPRSKRAARAIANFSVVSPNNKTITLKSGIVALGSVQGGNYIFSIPEDITSPVGDDGVAYFNNIEILEGSYFTKSYVVDSSQLNQKFLIPNPGVDTSTIRVRVSTTTVEEYKQYQNIFEVSKNTRLFLVQEILDEKYQILFGDGILGKTPENNSTVTISYIITNGISGNGAANFTFSGILKDNDDNTITEGISLLTTIQSSENGDSIEPVDAIKYLAPRVYSSQYRAVTASDYAGLVPYLFSNVESVTAYGGEELDPPQYGKVLLSVKPKNGSFLSQATKERILKQLKLYSVAGVKQELIDLKYLYVELNTNVYYNKSKASDVNTLKTNVQAAITSYSKSSDLNSFGGRFKYSKFGSLIDNVNDAITSNITKVKIRRNITPAYNRLANYELCFGNRFHLQKNNLSDNRGYNIKSTGFNINGVASTVYLSDSPIDDTTGNIFFFTLETGIPFIVSNNAGIVNYKTGEIKLNPVNITRTVVGSEIQVEAVPESNDVIALRDIYLDLNIQNTVVNMIEDTISSGENLSASSYAVTSSYSNGNYIR